MGSQFLVQVFNGLVIGSTYVLVALGVTLIYGILRVINFAHGEIFMLGAYCAYFLVVWGHVTYWLATGITMGVCAGLYVALERVAFRRLRGFELGPLITSIGASIFLQNLALIVFTGDPRALPTPYLDRLIHLGPLQFSVQRFLIIPSALLLILLLFLVTERTTIGRAIRAVSQDWEVASLMGVNPNAVVVVTFIIAGVLVAVPSVLVAPLFYVSPLMGVSMTIKAYTIVIMGGFGNVTGTIIAGLILGVAESMTAGYGGSSWVDGVSFAVLILFLLVRPYGLIGERREENA